MDDFQMYLKQIVVPTIAEFRASPANRRRGFLACVVIEHCIDYLAFPADSAEWDGAAHRGHRKALRKQCKDENDNFRLASEAANAFKHVKTTSDRKLEANEVYERQPAILGRMVLGQSLLGDPLGAVVVDGRDLLRVVEGALAFLQLKFGQLQIT